MIASPTARSRYSAPTAQPSNGHNTLKDGGGDGGTGVAGGGSIACAQAVPKSFFSFLPFVFNGSLFKWRSNDSKYCLENSFSLKAILLFI